MKKQERTQPEETIQFDLTKPELMVPRAVISMPPPQLPPASLRR